MKTKRKEREQHINIQFNAHNIQHFNKNLN